MGNILVVIIVLTLLFISFATWSCLVVGARSESEYRNKEIEK